MNAIRDGLTAFGVLLAHERLDEFRQHLSEWMESLKPASSAEQHVVFALADAMWRLRRVGRREDGLVKQHVQQRKREMEAKIVRPVENALVVFSELAEVVAATPIAAMTNLAPLLNGGRMAKLFLDKIDGVAGASVEFERALLGIERGDLDATSYASLGLAAQHVVRTLKKKRQALRRVVRAQVEDVAKVAQVADEKEGKRIERTRKLLEESMLRHLDLLARLRKVQHGGRRPLGSFNTAHRPPVLLRVVR